MFAVVIVAFVYVLLRSLSPTIDDETELFQNIVEGQTAMRRLDGRRVWISHLSERQRRALQTMPEETVNTGSGCPVSAQYCIVDAASARAGIELVYSQQRPGIMLASTPWVSGFIDPSSGAIYDILGRAYVRQNSVPSLQTSSR